MKKWASVLLIVVLSGLSFAACGSKERINGSGNDNGGKTIENEGKEETAARTVSYPVEIKLLDEKHADFYFDLNGITGKEVKADQVFSFSLVFPKSECEVSYEGDLPVEAGSDETIPPHAYGNFEGGYGCLGTVDFEVKDDHMIILHLSLTEPEVIDIATLASDPDKCELTMYLFDDENEYTAEYLYSDIVDRSGFVSRYADEIKKAAEKEDEENTTPAPKPTGDPSSVSLRDFVGEYRGINPFYVVDWDTYEMSEDVDHSLLTIKKTADGCEFANIVLDSDKAPARHETLAPITLKDSEMEYFLDDGQEDLWDCLRVESEYGLIILSKRQKDGEIMVAIDFGGLPQAYVLQKE